MHSLEKQNDKELLLEIIEMIETLVSIGTAQALDLVEGFGPIYLELETKIKNHDYFLKNYENHSSLCND